jgi:hypothetical protein
MAQKTYTADPSLDYAGCPVVMLAGREWFVPTLAMRQSRVVVPALMRLMPVLSEMRGGDASAMARMSEEDFENIIAIVHAALTRAYPALTRDEFLDLPASTTELVAAIAVVMRQTGFFKPAEDAAPGEQTGETTNRSTAPQPLSTES